MTESDASHGEHFIGYWGKQVNLKWLGYAGQHSWKKESVSLSTDFIRNNGFLKKIRHASEGWHPGSTLMDSSLRWNDDKMMGIGIFEKP